MFALRSCPEQLSVQFWTNRAATPHTLAPILSAPIVAATYKAVRPYRREGTSAPVVEVTPIALGFRAGPRKVTQV
jgi:hypothetical protein